jgi:hypothetical protein
VEGDGATVVLTVTTVDLVATVVFVVATVACVGTSDEVDEALAAVVVGASVVDVVVVVATVTTMPDPLTTSELCALPARSATENEPDAARLVVPLPPGATEDVTVTVHDEAVVWTTAPNDATLVPVKSADVTVVQSIGSLADTTNVTVALEELGLPGETETVGAVPSGTTLEESEEY